METKELLDNIERQVRRHAWHDTDAKYVASILWPCGSRFLKHYKDIPLFRQYPYMAFMSMEPDSGKSRALEVVHRLLDNRNDLGVYTAPYLLDEITDASDTMKAFGLEELDTILIPNKDNAPLIQWFNLGYEAEKYIGRKDRFKDENKKVHCFCPKAFSGLTDAKIPRATLTRIISVLMHPKPVSVHLERERFIDYDALEKQKIEIDAWYPSVIDRLKEIDLNAIAPLPNTEFLFNRNGQVWLPLLAIAWLAGEEWYSRALNTAKYFTGFRKEKNTAHDIIRGMCRLYMTGKYSKGIHTMEMLLPALQDFGISKYVSSQSISDILWGYDHDNVPKGIRLDTQYEKNKNRNGYVWHKSFKTWNMYILPKEFEEIKNEVDYVDGVDSLWDARVSDYLSSRREYYISTVTKGDTDRRSYSVPLEPSTVSTISTEAKEIKKKMNNDDDKELDLHMLDPDLDPAFIAELEAMVRND